MDRFAAMKDKIASTPISAAERKKTATVAGGKFPIPDKAHAKAALRDIGLAKPALTSSQKATVESKADAMLGKKK